MHNFLCEFPTALALIMAMPRRFLPAMTNSRSPSLISSSLRASAGMTTCLCRRPLRFHRDVYASASVQRMFLFALPFSSNLSIFQEECTLFVRGSTCLCETLEVQRVVLWFLDLKNNVFLALIYLREVLHNVLIARCDWKLTFFSWFSSLEISETVLGFSLKESIIAKFARLARAEKNR